jgi:hypothetical protein
MKNKILILLILLLFTTPFFAQQIIPVESFYDLRKNGATPDGTFSIKDVNNVLLRFVGTWKGVYNTNKYEIRIERVTVPFFGGEKDILVMRYKITNNSDILIEETLSIPSNNEVNIKGYYLQNRTYIFTYQGTDFECGQYGDVYISAGYNGNPNKMGLHLNPDHILLDTSACPNGRAPMPFPEEMMWLYKQ